MKRIFHQYPCPETAHQYAVSLSNRMIYAPDEQRLLDVLQEIKGVQEQFQLEEIMKIYLHSINVVQMAGIDPVRKEELDREIQLLLQRHPSAEMKGIYGFCLCRLMVEDDDQTENQKRLDEIRSIFEQDPSEQTALPYMIAIGVILGQGVSMEDRKSLIEILSRIVDQYPTQEIYQANMQALSNIKSEDENEETPIRFDA